MPSGEKHKEKMNRGKKRLRADHIIVAILFFIMATIAFANVLSRYLFHFSFAATEEVTINLFVWMTVIGTGLAFEKGGQLGMVTIFDRFPEAAKKSVIVFSAFLAAILFLVVDIYMIKAIYYELTLFNATSAALGIPVWIYYIGVPVLSIFVFAGIYRNAVQSLTITRK
jgi:TRAP-type C4-dicarboxylate transport system permease small subunit